MRKQIKRVLLCFTVFLFIFSLVDVSIAGKRIKHKVQKVKKVHYNSIHNDAKILEKYIRVKYPKIKKNIAKKVAVKTIRKCEEHDISHALVIGIIDVESSFNPNAKSRKGARGLMQVMYGSWKKEMRLNSKDELYDIDRNLDVGIKILKGKMDKNDGNLRKALRSFNGSGGNRYANKVLASTNEFKEFRNKNKLN